MPRKLPNYLRLYRTRTGFTQAEVAFLVGAKFGTTVLRYERYQRSPQLKTAFAFEVIYGACAREFFAGMFHPARERVVARAKVLATRLRNASLPRTPNAATARKLSALERIVEDPQGFHTVP